MLMSQSLEGPIKRTQTRGAEKGAKRVKSTCAEVALPSSPSVLDRVQHAKHASEKRKLKEASQQQALFLQTWVQEFLFTQHLTFSPRVYL